MHAKTQSGTNSEIQFHSIYSEIFFFHISFDFKVLKSTYLLQFLNI